MAMFEQAMRMFNPFGAGQGQPATGQANGQDMPKPEATPAASGNDAAIDELKRKLDELQTQLDQLSKKS
jgi:polyhydroxyalkanoate synthesis regulator protein